MRDDFQVFRLFEISNCLDLTETKIKEFDLGKRHQKISVKPRYKEEFLKSGILMTRILDFERNIIIHEKVKKALEKAKITGLKFPAEIDNPYLT